jgi:carbon monoxide dehydrogenase subunit G
MNITGTSTLSADRTTVWQALNDPAVLVRTIPGCRRLEALGDDAYTMTIAAGVGSIKGVYDGRVHLTDQEEPGSFRMHAQGAGAPGTIGADVKVTLSDAGDGGTELTYDAEAVVGGMIGGVGQRMLTGVSKKMAAEFFSNVDAVLTEGSGAAARTAEASPEVAGSGGRASATSPDGSPGGSPAGSAARTVFTAPQGSAQGPGFVVGVAVGAAAALAGAFVGAWIAGRRR